MDTVIYGVGGMGREVYQLIKDANAGSYGDALNVVGFLVGYKFAHVTEVHSLPILGGVKWLSGKRDICVVVAIGDPGARKKIVNAIKDINPSTRFPSIIHPQASIGDRVSIGDGAIVAGGVTSTTDIKMGNHVILNWNATLTHDDVIGDFVTVSPGATICGDVGLGEGCYVGANCTIIPHLSVGEWSIIGAGATVTSDIPANVTAVGVPAKVIKQREPGWQEEFVVDP